MPEIQKNIERESRFIVVIGYNGTGKTTITKKIITNALKSGQRALIVVPDVMEWESVPFVHSKYIHHIATYVGARKIVFEGKETLTAITRYFSNGILMFEDCMAYLEPGIQKEIHQLMIRRRQKMIDILAVGHGFTEIPPKFFTFASDIILFRTIDQIDRRRKYIKDFDRMKNIQTEVNEKAETEPHFYKWVKL